MCLCIYKQESQCCNRAICRRPSPTPTSTSREHSTGRTASERLNRVPECSVQIGQMAAWRFEACVCAAFPPPCLIFVQAPPLPEDWLFSTHPGLGEQCSRHGVRVRHVPTTKAEVDQTRIIWRPFQESLANSAYHVPPTSLHLLLTLFTL